jgi:hypothetical protein
VLEDLEDLRKRLADVSSRIRSADDKQLKEIYDELAGELLKAGLQLLPTRYMSRAAIWLAAATEAGRKAEASAKPHNLNELLKAFGDAKARQTLARSYKQPDWLTTLIAEGIRANARSAASALRRALRRARFLARVHWIVPRVTYIIWSFILLIVAVDSFIDLGKDELAHLLTPLAHILAQYIDVAPDQIENVSKSVFKIVLLLVVGWLLVGRLTDYLKRWQARLEKREVQKFASNVINASFQIRIYHARVQVAFFDAQRFAFEDQSGSFVDRAVLKWTVPEIESLNDLAPLPSCFELP